MVTTGRRRTPPEYLLDEVKKLAQRDSISYMSRSVQRDVENLSYGPQDVCKCLQLLTGCHFDHAEQYAEGGEWFDVYRISYQGMTDWG